MFRKMRGLPEFPPDQAGSIFCTKCCVLSQKYLKMDYSARNLICNPLILQFHCKILPPGVGGGGGRVVPSHRQPRHRRVPRDHGQSAIIIVIIILIIILITAPQSLAPRGRQPGGCGQDARPAHDPGPGGVQCRGRSEVRSETFYEIFSSLVTAAG